MVIDTSIIIQSCNSPEMLAKVLHGYNNQTYRNFEIVIADDNPAHETLALIEALKNEVFYSIIYLCHKKKDLPISQLFNEAIVKCTSSYILILDGACIPRADFVEHHVRLREKDYLLSGGDFLLNRNTSKVITIEDIYNGNCFDATWQKNQGLKQSSKKNNAVTVSAWKEDILFVHGFDISKQSGSEHAQLVERMKRYGIKSKKIR